MRLLNLPTDVLLHLLNTQFSLQDLLHLRSLCPHLCHLIESRHCIGHRRTLKLFWSFSDIQRYTLDLYYLGLEDVGQLRLKHIPTTHNDDLLLNGPKFSALTCDLLIRLLPRLEHLTIYFTHTKNYPDYLILRHMFGQLSSQLTGLSLFGRFNHSTCDNYQVDPTARRALLVAINQISSLKHFDMCLGNIIDYGYIGDFYEFEQRRLLIGGLDRIIPQLEHLTFRFRTANFERDIIRRLGAQCTTLRLHRVILSNLNALMDQLRMPDKSNHSIQLTHLQLTQHFDSLANQDSFAQLRTLELMHFGRKYRQRRYNGPSMRALLAILVPLKRLTGLTLMGFDVEAFESQINLPLLSGITHLSINAGSHRLKNRDAWCQGLSRVFPAVHRLTLAFTINYTIDPVKQVSHNFVQCTHFRLLHLNWKNNIPDMSHTLPSALARHHRELFRRQVGNRMHCIEHWADEHEKNEEQQWSRRSGKEEWIKKDT